MASAWTLQLHTVSFPRRISGNVVEIRGEMGLNAAAPPYRSWNGKIRFAKLVVRATSDASTAAAAMASSGADNNNSKQRSEDSQLTLVENQNHKEEAALQQQKVFPRLKETVLHFPPIIFLMKRHSGTTFAIGLCIAATLLIMVVRGFIVRRKMYDRPGSVADLVRRGQLRSDRRGISTPLKYEDPFNNPMVKVSKGNSTVEMCGKVYRLAPVSLTKEQQAIHKKRRSRAYQWKRPTIFLKEGDPIPPDVDPDTVRWIPANHPFATTASDIDEDLAQTNVYQKHGVPFRIQAEHEALQRRLEALQNDQKLGKLVIDPSAAKEFERPFMPHLKSEDQDEQNPANGQVKSKPPKSDRAFNSLQKKPTSEEMPKP